MTNLFNYNEVVLNNIGNESVNIIEHRLNLFFNTYIQNFLLCSLIHSKHGICHEKENFKMTILSSSEVVDLIQSIIMEVKNRSPYYDRLNLVEVSSNIVTNIKLNNVLLISIQKYNVSLNMTAHCENFINETLIRGFKLNFSSNFLTNIIKGRNVGGFILGSNNYKTMQVKYQKEINKQIEGKLLNIKCSIKNLLTNYIIRYSKNNKIITDKTIINETNMITA